MYGLSHYAFFGEHRPGETNLWESYKQQPVKVAVDDPLVSGTQSQNCIGTPDQIRATLRTFEESGVDQVIFLSQAGKIPHELLSSSIELFGREVLPAFKDRDQKRMQEKAALVERLNEKAMKRKPKLSAPVSGSTVIRAAGHH
jgi:alkanesulfonate monooxygenase SsuD/methylene tetrahydromethanopterin reductase-like flavin-dependent oxidoreductase (luciferase family)